MDSGLGIYGLLEGSVIVPKLEPDAQHFDAQK